MKKCLIILSMLAAVVAASCSQKKFDRIEPTENERYGIAYREGKCGVYDNAADSLVTELKYDALKYGRCVAENGIEFTVWVSEADGASGLLSITGENNETMEIMFPKTE